MPLNSLPDADFNLPEMKTKSPSCPTGGVHMYDAFAWEKGKTMDFSETVISKLVDVVN